jgi:DNA topoisomerase-3
MKERGIGTPATRAAISERLLAVDYIERDGRALIATEKGIQVIRLLGEHALTSSELTGDWERRLGLIEHGEDSREAFMQDIGKFTTETVQELDKLKGVKIERANLGPCPVCGRDVIENRKGYSCWSKDDPGCGFVIWKKKAGKNLPAGVVKELMASLKASIERGDEPPAGRTEKQVTGFRGRSGRSFRAKLKMEQNEEGKWRVDFDEEWAKEPPPTSEETGTPEGTTEAAAPEGAPHEDGAAPKVAREPAGAASRGSS